VTVARTSDHLKHLFEDTPCVARSCRTPLVHIRSGVLSKTRSKNLTEEATMPLATQLALAEPIPLPARARPVEPARPLATVTVLNPPRDLAELPPLRLTRRGVAVVTAAVLLLGGLLVWLAALSAPRPASPAAVPRTVTVQVGDTLWSIATRVAPDRDPRGEVAALEQANRLPGVTLTPGQTLRVP
jgi:nucleoid-associated protein YgaU